MDDTARKDIPQNNTTPAVDIQPITMLASEIPAAIKVKGTVREAWKWNDKLGDNIFITSLVSPFNVKDEFNQDQQTAEVYAFHYAKKNGDYVLVWQMSDAVKECSVDLTCDFIKGSTTVTDLDNDGIAETKIQYATACRGDVSPATMNLIMYENGQKFALKGNMWLAYSPDFKYTVTEKNVNLDGLPKLKDETDEMLRSFGRYESEKEFASAPPEFLVYARSEWLKYSKEKMGE